MYTVELKPQAQKFIESQIKKVQRQLIHHIEILAQNPRPQNSKLLDSTRQIYRVRSGSYRIIYQIRDKKLFVIVAKVADRKNIYKNLPDLLQGMEKI
jgi:mRNA interferase RelE/StbE